MTCPLRAAHNTISARRLPTVLAYNVEKQPQISIHALDRGYRVRITVSIFDDRLTILLVTGAAAMTAPRYLGVLLRP